MQTSTLSISIPQPCREIDGLPAQNGGIYCKACTTTVIDFSGMTKDELVAFFMRNGEQRVCGRFIHTQLTTYTIHIQEDAFTSRTPLWQKYLAVLLICFGSFFISCRQTEQPVAISFSDNFSLAGNDSLVPRYNNGQEQWTMQPVKEPALYDQPPIACMPPCYEEVYTSGIVAIKKWVHKSELEQWKKEHNWDISMPGSHDDELPASK